MIGVPIVLTYVQTYCAAVFLQTLFWGIQNLHVNDIYRYWVERRNLPVKMCRGLPDENGIIRCRHEHGAFQWVTNFHGDRSNATGLNDLCKYCISEKRIGENYAVRGGLQTQERPVWGMPIS